MTWGEIQIASLNKMFMLDDGEGVADLASIATDADNNQMLAAMPAVANEGLLRMATSSYGFRKTTDAVLWYPENLLIDDDFARYELSATETIFTASGAHSYCFQLYGSPAKCEIDVYNGAFWVNFATVTNTGTANTFTVYKGLITNASDEDVRLRFTGITGNKAQYIALFAEEYAVAAEVPSYAPYIRVYIPGLVSDYMQMVPGGFKPVGESARVSYSIDATNYITLPYGEEMHYQLEYKYRPALITSTTLSTYVLDIPEEYAVLVPLYIASQLYKDTDVSQATMYRNEFESALAVVEMNQRAERTPEQFYSAGGLW